MATPPGRTATRGGVAGWGATVSADGFWETSLILVIRFVDAKLAGCPLNGPFQLFASALGGAAQFRGDVQREYGWFATAATLPVLSMNADRAARRIVTGVSRGRPLVLFTPLAQGMLTDRYLDGIPDDSRAAQDKTFDTSWLTDEMMARLRALNEIAGRRDQTLAQLKATLDKKEASAVEVAEAAGLPCRAGPRGAPPPRVAPGQPPPRPDGRLPDGLAAARREGGGDPRGPPGEARQGAPHQGARRCHRAVCGGP